MQGKAVNLNNSNCQWGIEERWMYPLCIMSQSETLVVGIKDTYSEKWWCSWPNLFVYFVRTKIKKKYFHLEKYLQKAFAIGTWNVSLGTVKELRTEDKLFISAICSEWIVSFFFTGIVH